MLIFIMKRRGSASFQYTADLKTKISCKFVRDWADYSVKLN